MLEKIKMALRIKTAAFDADDITDLILAAKADLALAGVLKSKVAHDDKTIITADGDTWETIATEQGVTVEYLQELNNNMTVLTAGQTIYLDKLDELILMAVKLYVKTHFGLDNSDSEKYQKAYDALKAFLCLTQEYTVEAVV